MDAVLYGFLILSAYFLTVITSILHQALTHGVVRLLVTSSFGQGKRSGDLGESEQLAFTQLIQNSTLVVSLPLEIFDLRRITSLLVVYLRFFVLIALVKLSQ